MHRLTAIVISLLVAAPALAQEQEAPVTLDASAPAELAADEMVEPTTADPVEPEEGYEPEPEDELEADERTAPPDLDATARRLFEAGRDAYHQGEFELAVSLWERAFSLSGRAALLLGIGDAYDRLNESGQAADAIRQYLVLEPDSDSREHLLARIGLLEEDLGRDRQEPADEGLGRPFTWVAAGSTGLLAVTSGLFWSRANTRYDALSATCAGSTAGCDDGQVDTVGRQLRVANVTLALSVVSLAAAVILYFVEGPSGDDDDATATRRARFGRF